MPALPGTLALYALGSSESGISFSYKKRAACRENSSKSSAGGHWFRRMSGYERSYCKYSELEASSRLSLHVFSQFFHTFLPLCAASLWTIPRWRPTPKTTQIGEKHAQNRGKTPKIEARQIQRARKPHAHAANCQPRPLSLRTIVQPTLGYDRTVTVPKSCRKVPAANGANKALGDWRWDVPKGEGFGMGFEPADRGQGLRHTATRIKRLRLVLPSWTDPFDGRNSVSCPSTRQPSRGEWIPGQTQPPQHRLEALHDYQQFQRLRADDESLELGRSRDTATSFNTLLLRGAGMCAVYIVFLGPSVRILTEASAAGN
jgi:hypothetical protein